MWEPCELDFQIYWKFCQSFFNTQVYLKAVWRLRFAYIMAFHCISILPACYQFENEYRQQCNIWKHCHKNTVINTTLYSIHEAYFWFHNPIMACDKWCIIQYLTSNLILVVKVWCTLIGGQGEGAYGPPINLNCFATKNAQHKARQLHGRVTEKQNCVFVLMHKN